MFIDFEYIEYIIYLLLFRNGLKCCKLQQSGPKYNKIAWTSRVTDANLDKS